MWRDWSSDVCSSDLTCYKEGQERRREEPRTNSIFQQGLCRVYSAPYTGGHYTKNDVCLWVSTFSTLLSTALCYHTNAVNASPKVRTQQDTEPCYNNSVESWRCESTASTAALDDAHDFLRAQQRSAIRAERSLVFYLPRHAAFKLLSRVRREPRPKPQALSLPSKRCITASWRQQGRESSGKMVKAGKRRAKRYSLRDRKSTRLNSSHAT